MSLRNLRTARAIISRVIPAISRLMPTRVPRNHNEVAGHRFQIMKPRTRVTIPFTSIHARAATLSSREPGDDVHDAFREEEYGEHESQPGQSQSRVSNHVGSCHKVEDCDQEFPDNVAYAFGLKGVNELHQSAE